MLQQWDHWWLLVIIKKQDVNNTCLLRFFPWFMEFVFIAPFGKNDVEEEALGFEAFICDLQKSRCLSIWPHQNMSRRNTCSYIWAVLICKFLYVYYRKIACAEPEYPSQKQNMLIKYMRRDDAQYWLMVLNRKPRAVMQQIGLTLCVC